MFTVKNMPSTTQVLSTYTTFSASAMLIRSVVNELQNMTNQLLPKKIQEKIMSKLGGIIGNVSNQMTLVIDESTGLSANEVFEAAQLYLRTKITPSVHRLKVSKAPRDKNLSITINKDEKIVDTYEGMQLVWEMICTQSDKSSTDYEGSFTFEKVERKSFELSFDKKYKEKVLSFYLPYVMERAKFIKEENKSVKLYSIGAFNGSYDYEGVFGSVNFDHPSTFETLAMDPSLKQELIDDLDRFVKRRDYYRRIGKAWKRGYLLYGPPGTGKSSLIAAMANYLKFNIYDLELTSLQSNSDLRNLLVSTANRSILVIEDIDCSVDLENREAGGYSNQGDSQFTLSGLLNFIDGLWSSCGDERIIIFTTNHKEKLDPALLRPGRMDKHIHMSFCTPSGFKILASNYLGITNHYLFIEIEKLISQVSVTPAQVAEELMSSEEADVALEGLLKFLQNKKEECDKLEVEAKNGVDEKGNGSEIVSDNGGEGTEKGNKRKAGKGKSHGQKKRMTKGRR